MRWLIKGIGHLLAPTSRRFYVALAQPQWAQRVVQQRLVDRLRGCEYGRRFGIRRCEDWHRLPIVEYEDLQPWILRAQRQPDQSLLTPEPILFYEPTSGSSGAVKQIPYTRSLRCSFNHLFCVWAYDLITQGPAFSTGKLYFSISPNFSEALPAVDSGGTTDDSDYLDPWLRSLLSPFLVISPLAHTPEAFKENLARTLLQTEALEVISIWSPSFLTVQLDYIHTHRRRIQAALADRLSAARSRLLLQDEIPWTELWPQLKLISCWDSVTAADEAAGLRSQFPSVLVQGKGLLATEAPITLPLVPAQGYVPLLDEVFFEFEDSQGRCWQLHQLEVGQDYQVIISQTGGFYRYRLGDRVQMTHSFLATPCLEFLGRAQGVSDLVGEKLQIDFVSGILDRLALPAARFQSLVPIRQPTDHYVLLLDRCDREPSLVAQQLEQALCDSFHYRLARQLGQLAPVRVFVSETIAERLSVAKAQSGQRWGDIKHTRLGTVPIDPALLRQNAST
jgi:hypothetical protein